ncbi:MAG: STAS domain-containing protein, partial [Rhodocyclaceae bacterium]
ALALLLSWQRSARAAGRQLSIDRAPVALVSLASLYDVDSILSLAR